MRGRTFARALVAFVLGLAGASTGPGCGVGNGIVGGECAAGYVQCGLRCVPAAERCGSGDDGAANGDGASGGGSTDGGSAPDGTSGRDGSSGDAAAIQEAGDAAAIQEGGPSGDDGAGGDSGLSGDGAAGSDGGPPDDGSLGPVSDASGGGADAPGGGGDAAGDDGTAGDDGSTPLDAGGAEGGVPCAPPLLGCGEQCVDVTSDPFNCGQCGAVCPSQICFASQCVGASAGGIAFIGHDYQTTVPGTAQARVLSNAVFTAQSNPLNVLSYERYAAATAVSHSKAILTSVAAQLGRTLAITSTTNDADVPNTLTTASYGVLLVHDQPSAPAGTMAALGASWMQTVTTFALQGGVVVVLDGGTGVGEMPDFATATGLLTVTSQTSLADGTPLRVDAPTDAVGISVVSPYGAGSHSVSLTAQPSGANVVYVVGIATDGGPGSPVVIHRVL